MTRRWVTCILAALALTVPVLARAQSSAPTPDPATAQSPANLWHPEPRSFHWKLMTPFHAWTAAMQGLDAHSTFRAIDAGHAEGDPLLRGLSANRPAFIAVRTGVAAAIIYGSSYLARNHKKTALATLIGINLAYAFIVQRNYQISRIQR